MKIKPAPFKVFFCFFTVLGCNLQSHCCESCFIQKGVNQLCIVLERSWQRVTGWCDGEILILSYTVPSEQLPTQVQGQTSCISTCWYIITIQPLVTLILQH